MEIGFYGGLFQLQNDSFFDSSVQCYCGIFTGIKYLIIVITFLSLTVVYK